MKGCQNSILNFSLFFDTLLSSDHPPIQIPCRAGCSLTFKSIEEADVHVRFVHGASRVDQVNPSRSLQQSFNALASNTQNPPQNNFPPLSPSPIIPSKCDQCQQFFANSTDLNSHMQRKHSQSSLACPIPGCTARNFDQSNLVRHILGTHSQDSSQQALQINSSPNLANLHGAMDRLSLQQPLASLSTPPSLLSSHYQNPQAQYANLGGSNWTQMTKSGLDRTSNSRARVFVNWPHECIDEILAKRTFTYRELNGSALAAGSMAALFRSPEFYQCPESIQVYMQHLSFLFHCLSYSNNIEAILDFHASILSQVEAGLLTWSAKHEQTFTLQRLNFRAGLRDIPVFSQAQSYNSSKSNNSKEVEDPEEARRKKEANKAICKDFNSGSCPQPGDHDGKKHWCFFCMWKRDIYKNHLKFQCPRHPKLQRQ